MRAITRGGYLNREFIVLAMDELASLAIWAIAILHVLLAEFGFVKHWNITLGHQLLLAVGK